MTQGNRGLDDGKWVVGLFLDIKKKKKAFAR